MVDLTRRWLVLGGVCVLALWLRTLAIGFGLPAVYNMDEVAIMNRALAFGTGDLNPRNFVYPSFYFYALFAWEGLTMVAGLMLGWWDSVAAFQREFFVDPTRVYWSGRLLSALCGAATVAAVAVLATRLFDRTAGLIAAFVMAVTPIAVMDAHYVKHDVPVTLLIVLVHVCLARVVTTEGRARARDVWMSGALAGLAMSTHYYAVFVALPVAAVLLSQPGVSWPNRMRDGMKAGAAATVLFMVTSPFLLADFNTTWVDITQNRAIVMDRATAGRGAFVSLAVYLGMLADHGIRFSAIVLSFAGLVVAWKVRRRGALLTVFPVAFLLFISNTVPATRYLNPLLPFIVVSVAAAGGYLLNALFPRLGPKWSVVAGGVLLIVLITPGVQASMAIGAFFNQTDTRTLAQRWIETEVAQGSTILIQPYSVPLRQSRESLIEALRATLGSEDRATIKFQQLLALSPYPSPAYRTLYLGDGGLDKDKIYVSASAFSGQDTLAPLRTLGVQYVVLKRYNVPDVSLASLDRALGAGGRLVASFSPYRSDADPESRTRVAPFLHNTDGHLDPALERPGPVIEIWRIG